MKSPIAISRQDGASTVVVALVVSLGVGAAVYFGMASLSNMQGQVTRIANQDAALRGNIQGVVRLNALMSYEPNATANSPTTFPYLYPDPYIGSTSSTMFSSIGTVLSLGSGAGVTLIKPNNATVKTWAFDKGAATLLYPGQDQLHQREFGAYVEGGTPPKLTATSAISFGNRQMHHDTANHPYWIKGFDITSVSTTKDGRTIKTKASVALPPMPPPLCEITTANGETRFQPNDLIPLELKVSGVALEGRIPTTTMDLLEGKFSRMIDLRSKANSIRNVATKVFSWKVPAPRPLVAVDGTGEVPLTVRARLQPVDDKDPELTSCSKTLYLRAPATCKIFPDSFSVDPGHCSTATYGTVGAVIPGTFTLRLEDEDGNRVPGAVSSLGGNRYRYCLPPSGYSGQSVNAPVSDATARQLSSLFSGLSSAQVGALKQAFVTHQGFLQTYAGGRYPNLDSLTIAEVDALTLLTTAQRANLSNLDFSTITGLRNLSPTETSAIKALGASALNTLTLVDLSSIRVLQSLPSSKFAAFEQLDPGDAIAYLSAIERTTQRNRSYILSGAIRSTDGAGSSCIAQITAGNDACPFFSKNSGGYSRNVNVLIRYAGNVGNAVLPFTSKAPNWEVEAIAASPFNVVPCPADARCFAMDLGNNRTPFVTVQPINSASCVATGIDRIDLGCFEYDTRIRMADGTDRPIHQIQTGDRVMNPARQRSMSVKRVSIGPEKDPLVILTTEAGILKVTTEHPVPTSRGLKSAIEIVPGDVVRSGSGDDVVVKNVAREKTGLPVVNIELETSSSADEDHMVLADGIMSGDLFLQERLHAKSQGN